MKRLIINRSTWYRGQGGDFSKLLKQDDGKMCCLGFYLKSVGIEEDALLDQADPSSILDYETEGKIPEWLLSGKDNSRLTLDLVGANDDQRTTEADREMVVKKLFAQAGVKVVFED